MTQNATNTSDMESAGDGYILVGSGSGRPTPALITGDSNVTITPGTNSLTVASSVSGGALVKIGTATASTSASISFTGLSSTYFLYILRYNDLSPDTDATTLLFRTSTNNGVSYDSGVSDYAWSMNDLTETGFAGGTRDQSDSSITILGVSGSSDEMGSGANETGSGTIYIYNPSAAKYTFINGEGFFFNEASENICAYVGGYRLSAADVDAIQLLMDVGNIASGTFVLYGVKNA